MITAPMAKLAATTQLAELLSNSLPTSAISSSLRPVVPTTA